MERIIIKAALFPAPEKSKVAFLLLIFGVYVMSKGDNIIIGQADFYAKRQGYCFSKEEILLRYDIFYKKVKRQDDKRKMDIEILESLPDSFNYIMVFRRWTNYQKRPKRFIYCGRLYYPLFVSHVLF